MADPARTWILGRLEARVAVAVSLVGEAFALACEERLGLDDVDHEVVVDQLVAANHYLSSLIRAMHDDWDESDPRAVDVAEIAARHRAGLVLRHHSPSDLAGKLVSESLARVLLARRGLTRIGPSLLPRVVGGLGRSASHLAVALHVFDVDGYDEHLRRLPFTIRVQLHATQDQISGLVADWRKVVRLRRFGPDGPAMSEA